jgi:hypothetical protein
MKISRTIELCGLTVLLAHFGREAQAKPEILWGTYYGGLANDAVVAVAIDPSGNIYATGLTDSAAGIATPGAHQTVLNEQLADGFLVKFDPAGKRLWGTYFGASATDQPSALAVRDDIVVIAGRTSSPELATGGTFQTTMNGKYDGFVARFTGAGALVWATQVGGADLDSVTSVAIGEQGEVYAVGYIHPGSAVADPGSHQPSFGGGDEPDCFLLRLDAAGKKVWGTYYGGNDFDRCEAVAYAAGGTVYVSGTTNSLSSIATPGTFHPTLEDAAIQAFAARFDSAGVRTWGTYLGGGNTVAAAYPDGGLVVAAYASAPGLATDDTEVAAVDTLVVRLDDAGKRVWSTYFGGDGDEGSYGIAVDAKGAIYLGGYTFSVSGLATPDAVQPTLSGSHDAYVAKLSGAGARMWSTYHGGTHEDVAFGLAFGGGRLIAGGSAYSLTGIASPGSHQPANGGGFDGFLVQFAQGPGDPPGAACSDPQSCASGLCVDEKCCDSACGEGDPNDCQACSKAAGAAVDGTCGPRAPGVCRPSSGECDSEESCDGVDPACPADTLTEDGTPCPGGTCTAGICTPEQASTTDATTTGDTTLTTTTGDTTLTTTTGDTTLTTTIGDTSAVPTGGQGDDASGSGDGASSGDATGAPMQSDGGSCSCTSTHPPSLSALMLLALGSSRRRRSAV